MESRIGGWRGPGARHGTRHVTERPPSLACPACLAACLHAWAYVKQGDTDTVIPARGSFGGTRTRRTVRRRVLDRGCGRPRAGPMLDLLLLRSVLLRSHACDASERPPE